MLGGGLLEVELPPPPPPPSPHVIPSFSPVFEATEDMVLTKLSKIRALIWPLFGGRLVLCLFEVLESLDGVVAIEKQLEKKQRRRI